MASFFNYLPEVFSSSAREKLDTYSVVEVNNSDYTFPDIVDREDCLLLHQVPLSATLWDYNIVLLKTDTTFSLYRSGNLEECRAYFDLLKPILPVLLQACPLAITSTSLPKICEHLRANHRQNIIHVCAHFGFCDYLKKQQPSVGDEPLSALINGQDDNGRTPLHVAIENQQALAVTTILQLKPALDLTDAQGNTVIHYAAKTTRTILTEVVTACSTREADLSSSYSALINKINANGQTALHLAAILEKADCAKELLRLGANVHGAVPGASDLYFNLYPCQLDQSPEHSQLFNQIVYYLDVKTLKFGGSPLHWSTNAKAITQWLELKCHVNALNLQHKTALHLAVERQDLGSVIALLSNGANVNATDGEGNTPLHLAVTVANNIPIVQAVLVFGAKVDLQNGDHHSARHLAATSTKSPAKDQILYMLHSVGAGRCAFRTNCNEGCFRDFSYNGIPPEVTADMRFKPAYDPILIDRIVKRALEAVKSSAGEPMEDGAQRYNLLSLDGGGIRGLVMIQILNYIEEVCGKTIVELFDWVAGTSTGGILALLLASGYTLSECQQIYFRFKDDVFVGSKPHPSERLEMFLQKYLGSEKRMDQFEEEFKERGTTFRVMVPVTVVDYFPPELKLFRTYPGPNELSGYRCKSEPHPEIKSHEELVWKVGRATGAAPTFFTKFDIFLDGGLISNNPTLDLLSEVQNMNQVCEILEPQRSQKINLVLSLGTGLTPREPFNGLKNACLTSYSGISDMWALIRVLAEQTAQADGQIVERAQAFCSAVGVPYFRLNPPLSECYPLNETDNVKLVNMLWQTMAYLHRNKEPIKELVTLLTARK